MLLRGDWVWDKSQKKLWRLDVQSSSLLLDTDLSRSLNFFGGVRDRFRRTVTCELICGLLLSAYKKHL